MLAPVLDICSAAGAASASSTIRELCPLFDLGLRSSQKMTAATTTRIIAPRAIPMTAGLGSPSLLTTAVVSATTGILAGPSVARDVGEGIITAPVLTALDLRNHSILPLVHNVAKP